MRNKYEDRFTTTLSFEKAVYDKVNKLLPRAVTVTDVLNKFLEQKLVELETSFDSGLVAKEANQDITILATGKIEP
jgi:hypothetical protein